MSIIPTNCKYIADIPSILSSLIKLINFNLKTLIDKDDDELANEIRKNSRKCLNQVQQYGDESIQAQLSSLGYACSLSLTISTACGSVEEYDDEIWSQLFTIRQFLSGLQKGRLTSYLDNQLQLQAKTTPVNQPIEQIEEEGGLEEIEDHQFNGSIDNIKFGANEAKYVLQYIQIGLSNPNPWWYWLF
ncbi:MAG: hypothetical protein EZS28_003956 [Streblomastix strix]|uniref:Uncharacterized protein n=1 Tax=Streblomastix strix TaxID=222440 RepID=A0A5J4X001_9EUKA|nr:MAG: hypothetical protein EZS28_003956 [Streblomastix strix]